MVTPVPSSFDPATRIGSVVAGKYRLEKLLGVGGMGAVFEAVHTGVQRRFAVKVMTADTTRSPEAVRRFTQEAQAAGLIGHPHIVEVFDLGESEDGTLYMVMELLRGETLHAVVRRGPLTQRDAVDIALELLRALDAAHRAGIVHRDIKPHNLFLAERSDGGTALKVLDFGIAKFHEAADASTITRSGAIVGTPLYMAPEQVLSDREIDGRADIWAAGTTLFEMLTGRPVHLAPHAAAAAVRIVTEPAARVSSLRTEVDPDLDAIVAKALSIEREDRYASAAEMIEALEATIEKLPINERLPLVTPLVSLKALTPRRASQPSADDRRPLAAAPTPPSASPTESRRSATRSGLLLFGALALVGGAAAGSFLVPMPGVNPPPSTLKPKASVSVSASIATPAEIAPAPTAALREPEIEASAPTPTAVGASSVIPVPARSATPLAAGKKSDRARLDSGAAASPVASASAAVDTTPKCGAREVLSHGHCCLIGMVWQNDRCERPLATSFP